MNQPNVIIFHRLDKLTVTSYTVSLYSGSHKQLHGCLSQEIIIEP